MRDRHFDSPDSTTTRRIHGPGAADTRRGPRAGRTLLAAALFAAVVALTAVDRSIASVEAEAAVPGLGPIANLTDDLIKTLEDIEDELEAVTTSVGGGPGPLDGPTLDDVADSLDVVEAVIDDLFDAAVYPSLEPVDAGAADTSVDPASLPDYAAESLFQVRAALQDLFTTPSIDDDYIGSRLKTILYLLPGFRAEAGI